MFLAELRRYQYARRQFDIVASSTFWSEIALAAEDVPEMRLR